MADGFENFLPRYAIVKRNEYMLKKADYVIVYVKRNCGGAAKFAEKAVKQKKMVINIAYDHPENI